MTLPAAINNPTAFAHPLLGSAVFGATMPRDPNTTDDQGWPTDAAEDVPLFIGATTLGASTQSCAAKLIR